MLDRTCCRRHDLAGQGRDILLRFVDHRQALADAGDAGGGLGGAVGQVLTHPLFQGLQPFAQGARVRASCACDRGGELAADLALPGQHRIQPGIGRRRFRRLGRAGEGQNHGRRTTATANTINANSMNP